MSKMMHNTSRPSRRRLLKIFGAAVALPSGILALRQGFGSLHRAQWHGETLGALAGMTLWHQDYAFAQQTLLRMRSEVERLESVFSLYEPESEITRLNQMGRLENPSRDLVLVLEDAQRIASLSAGAFDPTVQPLWDAYSAFYKAHPAAIDAPDSQLVDAARKRVDYRSLDVSAQQIRLAQAGMSVTLNGIAQGYITDRIADLLRNEGFDHAMVELGETRAIGERPEGGAFQVQLMNPQAPGEIGRTVELANSALAVSGGYGLRFAGSHSHHIFNPATGLSANALIDVAVEAPRAQAADALSTAIYVAGEQAVPKLLQAYAARRAMITRADGSQAEIYA